MKTTVNTLNEARLGRHNFRIAAPAPYVEIRDHSGRILWRGHPDTRNTTWKWIGACHQDTELGDRMYSDNLGTATAAAGETCGFCLAREACLEAGLARPEKYGVWGGLPAASREFRALRDLRRSNPDLDVAAALGRAS